jgi:hypothetical protein
MKMKTKLLVCSAAALLSTGVGTLSAVKVFNKLPVVERLDSELDAKIEKKRILVELAEKESIACIKSGRGAEVCTTEMQQKSDAASKPANELKSSLISDSVYIALHFVVVTVCVVSTFFSSWFAAMVLMRSRKKSKDANLQKSTSELVDTLHGSKGV